MLKAFLNVWNHPYNKDRRLVAIATAIWWKFNQLFFHLPTIVTITDQYSIICYPESSFGSYIVYARWPEYEETNFLLNYLRSADTYIDIGAHIGTELLPAASKIKTGKLFGFEPTPTTYQHLCQNINLNNLESRITVFPYAVSDQIGTATFITDGKEETNHLTHAKKNKKGIVVKTVTLHKFVAEQKIKKINVLKIDTEGAELKVLKGAKRLLKKQLIEVIMFEVNKNIVNYGASTGELLSFIEDNHMQLYAFDEEKLVPITAFEFTYVKTINLLAALKTPSVEKRLSAFL